MRIKIIEADGPIHDMVVGICNINGEDYYFHSSDSNKISGVDYFNYSCRI